MKLKQQFPSGHSETDFKCFGPPATKDGEFENTKICDMGCFMQEAVDSNKYYHAAIVQSTIDNSWYAYFEYGRIGNTPAFYFIPCADAQLAESEYIKQLSSKNVKRGVWEDHKILGRRLIPKVGKTGKIKDLYLVQPQQTRATGLPNAKTITSGVIKPNKNKIAKKTKHNVDKQTVSLMSALNIATMAYTRSNMSSAVLPTQEAIDRCRLICTEALKSVLRVGDDVDDQVADKELKQLTRDIYCLVPKKKAQKVSGDSWILNKNNIISWQQDLDTFESSLYISDGSQQVEEDNPLGDLPLHMEWIDPKSEIGKFVYEWWPKSTINKHSWIPNMKIKNIWKVTMNDNRKFNEHQRKITSKAWKTSEKPIHQPKKRIDLNREDLKLYVKSGTHLLFHGTRSVNVRGILRESLRLPKQLVGVTLNGAMFGQGLYWADDWKKSAGYTSLTGSYYSRGDGGIKNRGAFMFAVDVCIGKPYVAPAYQGYTKPPTGHHSVFGKAGRSGVQNNEFITYESESHKMCYLMEFTT